MNDNEVDEEFIQAFGPFGQLHGISPMYRRIIYAIKTNYARIDKKFELYPGDAHQFTDLAWRLLGRYIANNRFLDTVVLKNINITDEKMVSLFSELTGSEPLSEMSLNGNEFGIEGVRSMVPFLENSPKLSNINCCFNDNFNSECFELLVQTLHGKFIKTLMFYNCNITDISPLSVYNMPNLQNLNLGDNNIGREGCIVISNLLQEEGTTFEDLYLNNTGMGDEEVELLATSLKRNTKLKVLGLQDNNITEKGCRALLKLLVDVSSIEKFRC